MAAEPGWAARWDEVYAQGDTTCSWFQDAPEISLRMLDAAGVTAADSVIDVGGGASPLAGALLGLGFGDVTVLDISAAAIEHARRRLGPRADQVHWLTADIRSWRPARRFAAWHDRAVLHFLTAEPDRQDYRRTLAAATAPGAVAVIGCFAPDGPQQCSGLPVARCGPGDFAAELGPTGNWWRRTARSTPPRPDGPSPSPGSHCAAPADTPPTTRPDRAGTR